MSIVILTPIIEDRRRRHGLPENAFAAASLLEWLELSCLAQVRSVPATVVALLEVDALMEFDQDTERSRRALDAISQASQAQEEGTMIRWDCCAGLDLKMDMAHGHDPARAMRRLEIDDPRAFDLLYEFPLVQVAVVQRPWIAARKHDGWPVEYRAIVVNGEVAGVSNYYPQMTLPASRQVMEEIDAVRRAAKAIVDALVDRGRVPWVNWPPNVPEQWQRDIQCTLDFIVREDGRVVFLEGGPGFGVGAHPCCFLDNDDRVHPIHGIALGPASRMDFPGEE